MKLHGADIVQMAQQGEEAAAQFVVPHFDFVVVSARDDEGLMEVEVDAADGAIMLLEAVDDGADAIIPPAM